MSETTVATRRLLIVDDEDAIRLVIRRAFADFQVEDAADAAQALMSIGRSAPDIVITDIHLTGMDGCALLARIRESHPEVPVIGISGYVNDEDVEDFDFDAFLLKPVELKQLRERVLTVLDSRPGGEN
ncbi:MAG: response regulator [Gemmatimonadetes bacterium]|jgi:two-component system nitrogen regulation response regulator GlnG|nr:response regulator [Gemmatimonadota bacterium]MBT4609935.1 response regulator [Gemmatimonadota bacterium]MBT5057374.1 response regulator [Gemmatimonadota bacterium]MBT5142294.1 response regulator [Gemmatimonadota bacterium]MBT5589121.1 response regulator [Gemmatimonadota bacterium]